MSPWHLRGNTLHTPPSGNPGLLHSQPGSYPTRPAWRITRRHRSASGPRSQRARMPGGGGRTPKRRPGGISAHKPDRAQCVMFNEVAFDQLQAAQPPPPPPASRSEAAPRLANYLYHNEGNGVECAAGQSAHSLARTNIQIRIEWSRASRSGSAQFLCRPHRSGDAYSGTAPPIEGLPVQPSNSPRSYLRIVTT